MVCGAIYGHLKTGTHDIVLMNTIKYISVFSRKQMADFPNLDYLAGIIEGAIDTAFISELEKSSLLSHESASEVEKLAGESNAKGALKILLREARHFNKDSCDKFGKFLKTAPNRPPRGVLFKKIMEAFEQNRTADTTDKYGAQPEGSEEVSENYRDEIMRLNEPPVQPGTSPATSPANIPATSPANIPATSPANIPATSPAIIPATSPDSILATSPDNIPATSPDSIPATSPANIPATSPDNIPATSPDTNTYTLGPSIYPKDEFSDGVLPSTESGKNGTELCPGNTMMIACRTCSVKEVCSCRTFSNGGQLDSSPYTDGNHPQQDDTLVSPHLATQRPLFAGTSEIRSPSQSLQSSKKEGLVCPDDNAELLPKLDALGTPTHVEEDSAPDHAVHVVSGRPEKFDQTELHYIPVSSPDDSEKRIPEEETSRDQELPSCSTVPPSMDEAEMVAYYKLAASQHGTVTTQITRVLLVGPTCVGKSSLHHLLVHNKSKDINRSSSVLEEPKLLRVVSDHYAPRAEDGPWNLVTEACHWQAVSDAVMKRKYSDESFYPTTIGDVQSAAEMKEKSSCAGSHPSDSKPTHAEKSRTHSRDQYSSGSVEACLEEAYKKLTKPENLPSDQTSFPMEYRTERFVHIIDSGGQLAFQDIYILPLLLDIPCTYIQVFKASVPLTERIEASWRSASGSKAFIGSKSHLESHKEFIQRSLSTMQTMADKFAYRDSDDSGIFQGQQPPFRIFFVGTFKDQVKDQRTIDEADKFIEGLKATPFYKKIQFPKPSKKSSPVNEVHSNAGGADLKNSKRFFLLDNHITMREDGSDPGGEKEYLNSLRVCVSGKPLKHARKLKVPLMWFFLQLIAKDDVISTKVITLDVLRRFCLKYGFIDDDSEKADKQLSCMLKLLHLLGFFCYFELDGSEYMRNGGVNYVCTDVAFFYLEVSRLLTVHYSEDSSGAFEKFKLQAMIVSPYEILDELEIDENIDRRWFLEVLCYLGIAARIDSKDKPSYFIPSCLPHAESLPKIVDSIEYLSLTFVYDKEYSTGSYDHYLPRGVFCRLVVQLCRSSSWQLRGNDATRTLLRFSHAQCGALIYVLEKPGHIQCHVTFQDAEDGLHSIDKKERPNKISNWCAGIRKELQTALEKSAVAIFGSKFTTIAQVSLVEPCSSLDCQELGRTIYATINDAGNLECSHCGYSTRLHPLKSIWFNVVKNVKVIQRGNNWILEESDSPEAAGTVPLPLQAESQQDRRPFRELLDSEPNRKAFIKAVQGPLMDKICSHKDVIKPQGTVDAKAPNAATELYNHLLSHADETCILKVLCIISASPSKEDTPEANRMQHELLHHFPHLISTMCRELGVKEDIAVIPTEVDLRTIADECGNASNSLLTYLGIRNVKIEQFRKDAATFTDGTQSALIFWLKGNAADEPTWESLLKAMEKAQMTNESKEWKQKIIDRYQELHGFSN